MDSAELEQIQHFKIKKMLKELTNYRGNGTSLISILIPAGGDLNGMKRTLVDEYGTATNIKSRVNRLSVLSAITTAQTRLKEHPTKLPKNGLALFCGEPFGSSRKVSLCFEPHKPLTSKLYLCDSRFHCESLEELLKDDQAYGFIIVDGDGTLYGKLTGNYRTVLHHYKNGGLPKKMRKGGQSAARFGRLAEEARVNYIHKASELANKYFLDSNGLNVKGIIIAGCAEMKDRMEESRYLDYRIPPAILNVITIGYGGKKGFNEAITLSSKFLGDLKYVREQQVISNFLQLIAKDTGTYCYGVNETMTALSIGSVEQLIVYEDLDIHRVVYAADTDTDTDTVEYIKGDADTAKDRKVESQELLVDYLVENYTQFGAELVIVSNHTEEGSQYVNGFGGLGGTLRWRVEETILQEYYDSDDDSFDFI